MKAWRAIAACRTAALGGRMTQCDACGDRRHVYHSCRNRNYPQCQTRAKEAWIAARGRELLPVPYFHLVFTLPHALNPLAATAPRRLYELLFQPVSETLLEFAADPRHPGGTPAFTLVLHTWTQDLACHLHLHALVAGGALTPAGDWVSPRRGFLFPVKALSRVFRGKFVAALRQEYAHGRFAPPPGRIGFDGSAWQALLTTLYRHDWVVYAKPAPGGPAQVLDYLARYTHKAAKLAICRALLDVPAPKPAVVESVVAFMARVAQADITRCSKCENGRLRFAAALAPLRPAYASRLSTGPPT